ncbi:hypothetical protein RZN25_00700 [Bacillaceae bacterium S4-13-56]
MSWKSIEMQVALPRTQDIGKIQELMQSRSTQQQEMITASQLQYEELKRTTVNQMGHKNDVILRDEKNTKKELGKKKSQNNQSRDTTENHPYLGKRIDLKG